MELIVDNPSTALKRDAAWPCLAGRSRDRRVEALKLSDEKAW